MSKYNCDLDYLSPGCDLSNEEINGIIEEADIIIESHNIDIDTLSNAYLKKAQCLQKLGKFAESKEIVERTLEISPEMPEALVRLGNVYNLVEKKYDTAIEYISKALEQNPKYAYGLIVRGYVFCNKGELDRAIMDYNEAIRLKPDYPEAYVNRAGVYFFKNENDRVIADCNEALRLKSNHVEAHLNRGIAYASRGEIDRATADFTKAIQLQPDIVYAINDRGVAYGKEDKYNMAIAIFSTIILLRPDYLDAINNRGIILAKKYDYENAIADFNKAIQLVPNNAASYFNLGNVYTDIGEYDRAIFNYSIGLKIVPNDIHALYNRGNLYAEIHDYDRAIADYTTILHLKPDYADAFYNRGSMYASKNNYDRALSDFTKAIYLNSHDAENYFTRGTVFANKNDYDSAIADYERTIQLKPDYVDAFFSKGNVYWRKGEHDKAIDNYTKAISLQPNHFGAFLHRGTMYEIKGECDKALDDYSKTLLILIELKETSVDPLYSKNVEFFYYLTDKILPKRHEYFWELPLDKLQDIPHFFIGIIVKFRNMGLEKLPYKELIQAVYSFWQSRKNFDKGITVYQYTTLNVLEKMRTNRRFHLKPATYQNDPEEGLVFYKRIVKYLKTIDSNVADIIESLSKMNSEIAVFIRSLTSCKNSLVMWDSSYSDNGNGISVGIPAWKINKGQGIDKTLIGHTPPMRSINTWHSSDFTNNRKVETEIENKELNSRNFMKNEHFEEVVPLWKMGLYKIIYLDENDTQKHLKDITDCLLQIEKNEYTEEFKELLGELFSSITHLIKDRAYAHEEEYRLLFVDSIKKGKKYIKTLVKDDICEGIYVETEPILFQDDKDIVFFGPKVSEVTINKYRHTFRLSGLPFEGSTDTMLQSSGICYQ